MMCLRNICGVRRSLRARNLLTREKCECKLSMTKRMEREVLKSFGLAGRMGKDSLVKRSWYLVSNWGGGSREGEWMG